MIYLSVALGLRGTGDNPALSNTGDNPALEIQQFIQLQVMQDIVNRPGVAGAVLQSPPSLID